MKFEQHWTGGFRGVVFISQDFSQTNIWSPYKIHMEANLTSPKKGQMSMYNCHFSIFGRSPVPSDL